MITPENIKNFNDLKIDFSLIATDGYLKKSFNLLKNFFINNADDIDSLIIWHFLEEMKDIDLSDEQFLKIAGDKTSVVLEDYLKAENKISESRAIPLAQEIIAGAKARLIKMERGEEIIFKAERELNEYTLKHNKVITPFDLRIYTALYKLTTKESLKKDILSEVKQAVRSGEDGWLSLYSAGDEKREGRLDDILAVINSLICFYEMTKEDSFLEKAKETALRLLYKIELRRRFITSGFNARWKPVNKEISLASHIILSEIWRRFYIYTGENQYFNTILKLHDMFKYIIDDSAANDTLLIHLTKENNADKTSVFLSLSLLVMAIRNEYLIKQKLTESA